MERNAQGETVGQRLSMGWISLASALLAAGVGASYAYMDLSLNRWGLSATKIGINAAMPALGWLLATPLMPWALCRFSPRRVVLALLAAVVLAALGFAIWPNEQVWLVLRFVFGGGAGMAFRLIEYWITASSAPDRRARNMGLYSICFCLGAASGAGLVPVVGLDGWPPVLMMAGFAGLAWVSLLRLSAGPPAIDRLPSLSGMTAWKAVVWVAVVCGLIYGLFEPVAVSLMPVHVARSGLGEDWAAWGASGFLIGQILFQYPLGALADRAGRVPVMAGLCVAALVVGVCLPLVVMSPVALVLAMILWGGAAGTLYILALALLADHCGGRDLAGANAAFGTLYALGSLLAPPLHGLAMDAAPQWGLALSSSLLFVLLLVPLIGLYRRDGGRFGR